MLDGIDSADVSVRLTLGSEQPFPVIAACLQAASEDRPTNCPWRAWVAATDFNQPSLPVLQEYEDLLKGQEASCASQPGLKGQD